MAAQIGITDFSAYVPAQAMSRAAMVDAIGWTKPALKNFGDGARRYAEWDARGHLRAHQPIENQR